MFANGDGEGDGRDDAREDAFASGHLNVGSAPVIAPENQLRELDENVSLEQLFESPELNESEALTVEKMREELAKTPKNFIYRYKFLSYLCVLGLSIKELAERTGYSQGYISRIQKHPEFQREVETLRDRFFGQSLDHMLKVELPQAVKVVHDVLRDSTEKGSVRVDTAFRIMDRTHGKPVARFEHTGSLLKDLFSALDAKEASGASAKPIDAEFETVDDNKTTENEKNDAIDAFIKETYGKVEEP